MAKDEAYQKAVEKIEAARRSGAAALNLSEMQLTQLPESIGGLKQLQKLYLQDNRLTSLPESIGDLAQLQKLYLHNNQLISLPESIGGLTQLNNLLLSYNQLTFLPESLGKLAQLSTLTLDENRLESVPESLGSLESLERLSIVNNRLTELPASFCSLKSLKTLFLQGNLKLDLPQSVLGKDMGNWGIGPNAKPILDYYFRTRLKQDRRPLREAKLILLGRGDAGKTSLVRRLVENKFSRREDRTQGIRITQWPLKVKPREEVRLHVWDFGGQEIMHATHQFFLTDRSVYLLVLDGRGGMQETEADYWLRLVGSFAPESPVLVVLNKIKKDPFDLNRRALQAKYPQVRGFIEPTATIQTPREKSAPRVSASTPSARRSSARPTSSPTYGPTFRPPGSESKRNCRPRKRTISRSTTIVRFVASTAKKTREPKTAWPSISIAWASPSTFATTPGCTIRTC